MLSLGNRATALGWFVGSALGCNGDTTAPTGETGTESPIAWSRAFDTEGVGALSGVWGSGPSDVWMVGGQPDAGEIFHFDGSTWSPVTAPDVDLLVWVYGFAADDAYAVGVHGAMAHWDGAEWSKLDPPTTEDLWGVWGAAPNDLWIVGGDPNDGDPLILRYDGATFTQVALDPAENDRNAHALFKVWGIGGRTWAVGQYGLLVEWDGMQWVQQSTGASDDFVSLWGTSPDHVLAVGGRSTGLVSRFDGTAWTTTELPRVPGLSAVSMGDPDHAVVGGIGGYVGSIDPNLDGGDPVGETPIDTVDVHALWYDGAGTYYGVAGHFFDPYYGTALVRTEDSR
ncbi:MAG: hypothetical protein ABMA64_24755 [Myxococcota bacterium]